MKKFYLLLLLIFTLQISCTQKNNYDIDFSNQINKRTKILNNSYKFNIIPENLQNKTFDTLKFHIDRIFSDSKSNFQKNRQIIIGLFATYGVAFSEKSSNLEELKFNIILGLDELIFKYLSSRLNFSDYQIIVVPNKTNISSGDVLKAKIYLTVSDSLYEPEIRYSHFDSDGNYIDLFNLPCDNGIGELNMKIYKQGSRNLQGYSIYKNEFGSQDTLQWNYEFKIEK